ncbi:Uncharacterised protein [Vibrio cholerae]|nr:Uncharacterised protein [Vibrio cholerae]
MKNRVLPVPSSHQLKPSRLILLSKNWVKRSKWSRDSTC